MTVVSLRDDLMNVREQCDAPTYNVLAGSNRLQARVIVAPTDETGAPLYPTEPGWTDRGCEPLPDGTIVSCVHAEPIFDGPADVPLSDAGTRPVLGAWPLDDPSPFRVTFAYVGQDGAGADATEVSYTHAAELQQPVVLSTGMYRVSWYGRMVTDGFEADQGVSLAADAGGAVFAASAPLAVRTCRAEAGGSPICEPERLRTGWTRYVRYYRVSSPGEARVRIFLENRTGDPKQHSVDVAGIQLEHVDLDDFPTSMEQIGLDRTRYAPRPFVRTERAGIGRARACEDTDGSEFRQRWAYHCSRLCDAGYQSCAPLEDEDGAFGCYWETEVLVTREAMESRAQFGNAGLALGNFNYRIDKIALNFTGSGARSCANPALPSTCYNAGWIPYSIEHLPPYDVLTYDGTPYSAPLVVGRIGQARGLAAERYITNPVSSTDRALLSDYMRDEFRGRPLSGRFVVRVWDVPGVNFGGIEDVQLVLEYRYLTRTPAPTE